MVLSTIIFLEDKHKMLLPLSIFYEYQQFFQHRICFLIQPPDYSDPWPRLARSTSFFLIMLFKYSNEIPFSMELLSWVILFVGNWNHTLYRLKKALFLRHFWDALLSWSMPSDERVARQQIHWLSDLPCLLIPGIKSSIF